ncbi:MAG: T9SS type A sorting domain-containing protein, partial [Flavicella sp.]|nr:T9SS type A sorting domain-containing protein [Flavicella sp.]
NGENISMHRQIGISFNQHNSFAFDNGYDSSMFDIGETDMYWQFPNDDNKYIIAGVQEISDDLQIPLVVKMGYSGDISFTIDEWQAIDRIVYIKDNYTGVLYPLNNGKISLYAEEGLYEDRFVLSFSPEGALDIIDPDPMENLLVYFNINTNGIVVKNYKQQITEAALFDVLGNEIHTWSDFSEIENDTLKTPYLKTGVYIIQLKIDGKTISKKIMASNY